MAKEYIERDAAIKHIRNVAAVIGFENPAVAVDSCVTVLERLSSADVVEVVRCRDCVYRHLSGKPPFMFYTCTVAEGLNVCKDNSFCSYGERRDNNAD